MTRKYYTPWPDTPYILRPLASACQAHSNSAQSGTAKIHQKYVETESKCILLTHYSLLWHGAGTSMKSDRVKHNNYLLQFADTYATDNVRIR